MFTTSFRAMGSQFNFWLETTPDRASLLSAVPQQVEVIECVLSRFREDSELSRLNREPGKWIQVSDLLFKVIEAALSAAQLSDGFYNPLILNALMVAGYDRSLERLLFKDGELVEMTVPLWTEVRLDPAQHKVWLPAPIDLGGIGKGWTGNYLAQQLSADGTCLIDVGGDLLAVGQPNHKEGWAVQVHDPGNPTKLLLTLRLKDQAVATSGTDYRRWGTNRHHLIDPRDGKPAQTDVISATVIHPDIIHAEAYAKAVILQGSEAGLQWLANKIGLEQANSAGLVICQDGRVLATENIRQFILEGV